MKQSVAPRVGTAVMAILAVVSSVFAWGLLSSNATDSTVVGVFADASPLVPGNEVRAAGVAVGEVEEIELQGGKARVTLEVDPEVALHRDAKLKIRPVDLLGEHYIELDPGSPTQPYLEAAVIPESHTSKQETLQDLFNTFDDPTSTALAALITTSGEGLDDSGSEAAAAIKVLAPAMRDTDKLARVLQEQNAVLNELLERARPVAQAVAANDGDVLDRVVDSTDRLLTATAANQQALDQTLAELPATVTAARRTLGKLARVSDAATPTLRAIRPVTDNLTEIRRELDRLADAADPALTSLRPVLKRGDALLEQAGPAVARLRRFGPVVRSVAQGVRPLGDELLNQHLGDLMKFVKYWALSTNDRDALGHYFRGVFHVTPRTLDDLTTGSPSGGRAPSVTSGTPRTLEPKMPIPEPLKPAAPKLPRPTAPDVSDGESATGLTQQQERSMLGQLLGGA